MIVPLALLAAVGAVVADTFRSGVRGQFVDDDDDRGSLRLYATDFDDAYYEDVGGHPGGADIATERGKWWVTVPDGASVRSLPAAPSASSAARALAAETGRRVEIDSSRRWTRTGPYEYALVATDVRPQLTEERRRYLAESRRIAQARRKDPPGTVALFLAVNDLGNWLEPPEGRGAADYTPDPVLIDHTLDRIVDESRRMTPEQRSAQLAWMMRKARVDEGRAMEHFEELRADASPHATTARLSAIRMRGFRRAVEMAQADLDRRGLLGVTR